MRILHTADWHLCDKLGRIDRTADLRSRVEIVASLCEQHTDDVLLIAGDLFSEQASIEQMTESLDHIRETFRPFFLRGGTIVAITGNHDRDGKIDMVRASMKLAVPVPEVGGRLSRGRMYLQNGFFVTSLADGDGLRVQFALVPYPTVSRYANPNDQHFTTEEQHRVFRDRINGLLVEAQAKPSFDTTLHTVLAAHLHVRGAEVHSLYKLTERDDVVFDTGSLPTAWAYIALGHIHKPQTINGMVHVRYCGSLDRLDFGERDNDCGVLLVDIGPAGLRGPVVWLPIEPTPFHDITLDDPANELSLLAERYPDHERAIVRVTVDPSASGQSRDEIRRALDDLFPRLKELKWADLGRPAGDDGTTTFSPRADHASTVREYLSDQLADDPDRAAILELANSYLNRGGAS